MPLEGLDPNSPTVQNDKGASQSDLPYRFDLIDTKSIFSLANILEKGARKYGNTNWYDISKSDHLNHALAHIYAYLHGDVQDNHLGHAFARLMFALSDRTE